MQVKPRKRGQQTIARRWTLRIASLVGLFLLLLVIGLTLVTRHFVYNGVRQQLMGQAQSFVEMEKISGGDFYTLTKAYVEQLPEGDVFAVAVDDDGEPFAVSQGTAADYAGGEDFQKAAAGAGVGEWMGTLPNGQMVMAMTALVQTDSGQRLGGIRLFHPMGGATATVLWICAAMIGSGLLLLAAVLLVSRRFVNGMMAPLKEITFTANKIAQGDFNIRLEKQKEDEIGELCDAINHMAISLDTTENMKNEFVSSVSHELRTPLTAIKGWAETMQDGDIDRQTFDRGMNVIIRESERLSGIVEELLDFSRMQSGKMKINMERMDLLEGLSESVYLFSDRAKAEHKYLLYEPPKSLPPVYGDGNRLRQVFVNIIDNALKYTDPGGTVNVSVKWDNDFIRVVVADNGCGIPAEHLPNVRRKFYKANQTIRGSGIGLALADEIMVLHAGKLDIESHENLGTAVTLTFPTYENLQRQKQKLHG